MLLHVNDVILVNGCEEMWRTYMEIMDTVVDGAMFIFNAIPICNLTLDENSFRFVYGDTIGAL